MKRLRNIVVLVVIIAGLIALFLHNRQTNEIATFKWVGTVEYDTLSGFGWRQWDQMKQQIPRQCRNAEGDRSWPWYPRRLVNGYWDEENVTNHNDHIMGINDFSKISVKTNGHWRDFYVSIDLHGDLAIWLDHDSGELPSKYLEDIFKDEVYKSPFKLRRIFINYNGYNPTSLNSTADITCLIVQNR